MDLSVIPECYIDTNLAETLVPPQQGYNHQKGCGTVTKVMKENFSDDLAIGIVDKDKKDLRFKSLFKRLKAQNLADLELLTRCITYLKAHLYNWDINELKAL